MLINILSAKIDTDMIWIFCKVFAVSITTTLDLNKDDTPRFDASPAHDADSIDGIVISRVILLPLAIPRLPNYLLNNAHANGFLLSV
jgi:hypothetical protein